MLGERPMLSPMARTLVIAAASALLFASLAQAGGNPQRTRSADASRSLMRTVKARPPRSDRRRDATRERTDAVPERPTSVAEANADRAARQVKAKCERRELDCSRDKEIKTAEGEG